MHLCPLAFMTQVSTPSPSTCFHLSICLHSRSPQCVCDSPCCSVTRHQWLVTGVAIWTQKCMSPINTPGWSIISCLKWVKLTRAPLVWLLLSSSVFSVLSFVTDALYIRCFGGFFTCADTMSGDAVVSWPRYTRSHSDWWHPHLDPHTQVRQSEVVSTCV